MPETTVEEELDDAGGGSASIDNRGNKPYLRPKSLKQDGVDQRGKFLDKLTNYLTSEASNGAADRMEKKSQELSRYTDALTAHPELSHIYMPLIESAAAMLKLMQAEELRRAREDDYTTPPSSQPSSAQKIAPGSGGSGGSGGCG